MTDPFEYTTSMGTTTSSADAQSRIEAVKRFNLEQCYQALKMDGVQKSVLNEVHKRVKRLELQCTKCKGTGKQYLAGVA